MNIGPNSTATLTLTVSIFISFSFYIHILDYFDCLLNKDYCSADKCSMYRLASISISISVCLCMSILNIPISKVLILIHSVNIIKISEWTNFIIIMIIDY